MADQNKPKSSLNFQDLNINQITKALTENQNTLIKAVIVLITLVIAVAIFNNYHTKEQALRLQITKAQSKVDAGKAHDQALKDLNDFKSSIRPSLDEFELTALISDYAKSCRVNIPSLSPGDNKDMGLYNIINFHFTAVSDNFKDMMLFLRKIEKSQYPLRVNAWSGQETSEGQISFDLDISAVIIHT